MNEIVSKFLLAGNKFMPEIHLSELGFPYKTCGSFTKNKERIQKNQRNRKLTMYLSKWTNLFSIWHANIIELLKVKLFQTKK